MISLVLIDKNDQAKMRAKFDQILAMMAFEIELKIVFISTGKELLSESHWKMIAMYSDDPLYVLDKLPSCSQEGLSISMISDQQLDVMIKQADVIL